LAAAATELGVPAQAVRAGPEALATADAVFLTNALIGVRPVAQVDDRSYRPDPLVARLAAAIDR
jgi:branched-chain amino acid aminotransferase/4-amino-4-deoxychorismate lyase